ncbi:helix-turn-helix transcriptional regulator [Kutzneria kofuensis]|uniref:DNA-binding CsgD family transcriptional regulator n=1 Tax=Kutzneria kofuensis TaxID=103725 RepID=A0A7W9NKR3_9PSEU|nr:helix-turn-helix transcriptional regulator [Kutzneria kofuensis]MBB5895959.1 DNA-binding CsgD family transcriptional regulator [Kutzneria kofuensis]
MRVRQACVGRDAELAVCREALSEAPAVVCVEAGPRMGRTTLLKACAEVAAELGFTVLAAQGSAVERDFAYELAAQLFEPVAGAVMDRIASDDDPKALQAALRELYREVRELAARTPVLIAVDNLDLADDDSLRLLDYLRRRLADLPIVMIVTALPGRLGEFARDARRITLGRLDERAVRALVSEDAGLVHRATGGHPWLVAELLRCESASVGELCREPSPELTSAIVAVLGPELVAVGRAVEILGTADIGLVASVADVDHDTASRGLVEYGTIGVPLVTAVLTTGIPSEMRLRAARALYRRRAEFVDHLLATDPIGDEWTCRMLREHAATAMSDGDPERAAECLRRLLAEPLSDEDRWRALAQLGEAEVHTDPAAALEHLTQAGGGATLAYELAERGQLVEAARVLADVDDDLVPLSIGVEHAGVVDEMPALPENPRRQRFWHAIAAASHALEGDRLRAAAALKRAAGRNLAVTAGSDLVDRRVLMHVVTALSMMDDFDEAERLCDNAVTAVSGRVRPALFRLVHGLRTEVALRRGDLREARRLTLAQHDPHVTALAPMIGALIDVNEPQAAAVVLSAQGLDGEVPGSARFDAVLFQRGRLRAADGDKVRAVHDLLECGRRLEQRGVLNPAVCPWRSTAALLLAELGDRGRAVALVERELHLARRWGSASTVGVALRGAGVVTGDAELLAEAVDVLRESPARLEYGRALADRGQCLRESGDELSARSVLRMAHDMAMRCGSVALMERAGRELRQAGGRRRFALTDPALLTERESFVARRAAAGRTNKEIAGELYVTTRSVEFALTSVYRKLGVSGRRELRSALGLGN